MSKKYIDQPVQIWSANFYFKYENGKEFKVKEVVCKRLPIFILQNEFCYTRILSHVPNNIIKDLQKKNGKLVFRAEYVANTYGFAFKEPVEKILD